MKIDQNLIYDSKHHLKLDYYEATSPKVQPETLILIHGGGWLRGSKDSEKLWAQKFAQAGYAVLVPDYRLAPPDFYPAPVHDLDRVYQFWRQKSPKSKLVAIGTSVGGTLAVELAIKYGIKAVALSGIFDMAAWVEEHPDVSESLHLTKEITFAAQQVSNERFYKGFILNYLNHDHTLLQQVTPIYRLNKTTGPLFLINSLQELAPVAGVIKMVQALAQVQVPCWVQFLPGTRHGQRYALELTNQIINFIQTKF